MSKLFYTTASALLLTATVLVGCSKDQYEMTKTERMRENLNPEVQRFLLASEAAYKQGSYRHALALTDSAEKYAPDLADIHFLRGHIYTELNQLEIAKAAYEATLEADPEYHGAYMNMGVNHLRRGELRDAINDFRREEELHAHSSLFLEMGRAYAKLGVPDSAQIAYERAIELDSTNATAYMWLGQLHEETGDFEKALTYSRKGAELRPKNLDYKYIIGSQLFRSGNVEEAAEYLHPVAEERTWHHGAQYNMGQALMRMGREEEAERYLARAEEAQKVQQEINEAHEAINRNPNDLQNWLELGEVHRDAKMYDRAIDAYKRAIAIEPGDLSIRTNLATLILESGSPEDAIPHYRAVVRADSSHAEAWLNLGVAYGNAGRLDEAREAWQQVVKRDPSNRAARQYLSQLRRMEKMG